MLLNLFSLFPLFQNLGQEMCPGKKRGGHCPCFYCLVYDAIVHTIKRGLKKRRRRKRTRCFQLLSHLRFFANFFPEKAKPPEGSNLLPVDTHASAAVGTELLDLSRTAAVTCVSTLWVEKAKTGKRVVKVRMGKHHADRKEEEGDEDSVG